MVYGNSGVESFEYFNRSASVEYMGNLYSFDEDDFMEIISPSNYWHGRSDPSSWLCEAIVRLGKSKFHKVLPRNAVITLCADALNITHEKLESSLDWNAGYMAWHEGGSVEEFHVWMKS